MKMLLRSTFIFSALALTTAAVAAQSPPATETSAQIPAPTAMDKGLKLAFVNFSQILEGTEEAKKEINDVRVFMESKQSAYDTQAQQLQTLKSQFEAQERTLNAETRNEMQKEITEKTRALQRFQEDTQLEINQKRDGLFSRLSVKIQTIMNEYAQKNNLSAILFMDQLQGYFNPALDVTPEIIRIYNERYPSGTASNGN